MTLIRGDLGIFSLKSRDFRDKWLKSRAFLGLFLRKNEEFNVPFYMYHCYPNRKIPQYSNELLVYSINDLDRKGIIIHNATPENHNTKKLAV